jgi:ATP-binding cassette, subfamily B, bacterial
LLGSRAERQQLGSPRLLLLDEADANLDPRSSSVLQHVLRAVAGQATVLVVTHRRAILEAADAVWHLRDGRLVEQGAPRELLSGDTATARLFGAGARVDTELRRVA